MRTLLWHRVGIVADEKRLPRVKLTRKNPTRPVACSLWISDGRNGCFLKEYFPEN